MVETLVQLVHGVNARIEFTKIPRFAFEEFPQAGASVAARPQVRSGTNELPSMFCGPFRFLLCIRLRTLRRDMAQSRAPFTGLTGKTAVHRWRDWSLHSGRWRRPAMMNW